jgi:adenylate cyclase
MAVFAADAVGNGRLVVPDGQGTPAAWIGQWQELIHPRISVYGRRIGRMTGHPPWWNSRAPWRPCAAPSRYSTMLRRNAGAPLERIEFRVGINVGDVIVDGRDMWGIAVNVAMRLAALAKPGGIYVSGRVREELGDKLDVDLADTGERKLKNIARPVRVFSLLI